MLRSLLKTRLRQLSARALLPNFNSRRVFSSLEDREIYQQAIDNNEIHSAPDAINKAFAYLNADWKVYGRAASELFLHAREMDNEGKYKEVVDCGLEQAKYACYIVPGLSKIKRCFYVIRSNGIAVKLEST